MRRLYSPMTNDGDHHDSLFFVEIPIRDISVHALTADLAVCPERGNLILHLVVSFLNRTEILIGIAPGIFRKLREVSSELPFFRDHTDGGLFNERLEALFRRGIDTVIQFVELQRSLNISNLNFGRRAFGVIRPAHDARDDQGRKNGQDGHDDHDLDECKAGECPAARGASQRDGAVEADMCVGRSHLLGRVSRSGIVSPPFVSSSVCPLR